MDDPFVQQVEPEKAFSALTNETRLHILEVLWESDAQMVSFSELRRAVGMRDPGQFNYHLEKLVGQFVTKAEGGYRLTQAGKHVVGTISSGMYTVNGTIEPIVLNHSCQRSGEPLMLWYENETVRIRCDSCSSCPSHWEAPVPPAAFAGYSREEIPDVVSRYFRTKVHQITNSFCPYCHGQMEPTVNLIDTEDGVPAFEDGVATSDNRSGLLAVQYNCQRCAARSQISLDHALLLANPVVFSFYYQNGVDLQEWYFWEFSKLSPSNVDVENLDPIQVKMTFQADASTLSITIDENYNLLDVNM